MKKILTSRIFTIIWSTALAAVLYFMCPESMNRNSLLYILVVLLVVVNLGQYRVHAARFLVGGLFVFSGFIKANDPLGFSYKLEEYFQVFQGDTGLSLFEYLAHASLPFAIIICASEIVLGVMLLIGYRRDLTLWLLLAQIVFFTFLTFYSAYFNKVTRCGCFGDFLLLTPWESFWKDLALLVLIALLFAERDRIGPVLSPMIVSTLFMIGLIFSIAFPVYAYRNLPPLDFRAYAPGENIKDNMALKPTYMPPVIETGFIYENIKTGEKKRFNLQNYPWQDTLNWKWFATDNLVVKEAVDPPRITDFSVNDLQGSSITDSVLNNKNYSFWLIMHELKKTDQDEELMAQVNDFYKLASAEGFQFIAFTASSPSEIDEFKHAHNALYDFAIVDNTVLKTMIRSNPGLMLMKNGTVVA
ncbi:MAG TPA: BT_3928 family protein, partial [Chitinophagaceae bacterium]|nr:BT_3928 family protein [Chitinophagaceae bacterium]